MESIFLIIVSIMIFFIIGFWHGGTLNYIMFGVYNGILVCITYILKNYINKNNVVKLVKIKIFNILILNCLLILVCYFLNTKYKRFIFNFKRNVWYEWFWCPIFCI